jgi:hypothetical protein
VPNSTSTVSNSRFTPPFPPIAVDGLTPVANYRKA